MSDTLTVLRSVNRRHAAKRFTFIKKTSELRERAYSNEKHFSVEIVTLAGFDDLCGALDRLSRQPFAFIVRGEPLTDTNRRYTRRLLKADSKTGDPATFAAVPRRWLLVDVDHVACPAAIDPITDPEAAIEYLIGLLPGELADISCYWQFSSSQSLPNRRDTLSAHLAYWSTSPLDEAALKRWAKACNFRAGSKIIDPALYTPVQPHYIAAPLFDGLDDPLPRRCGIRKGLDDEALLIIPPPDAKDPEAASAQGYEPGNGVDYWIARIGGEDGFREPIKSAIASYIAIYGSAADCRPLKQAIVAAIDKADPGGRSAENIELYKSDAHLDAIITWVRQHHGDQPPKFFAGDPPSWLDQIPNATEADNGDPPADTRPIIRVVGGQLPQVIDRAESVLLQSDRDVYSFGDTLVRPALAPIVSADRREVRGLRLVPIGTNHLIERFTRLIDFQVFRKSEDRWVSIDCPPEVARTYLARVGAWRLRNLIAITACPLLLPDGRVLERPGFDAETGILFDPQGADFPPVPQDPTKTDAQRALDELKDLFKEFPFVDERSKAVHLSALLSIVARIAFRFVPMHTYDAPAAGTGKSKLVDCCSILATGHECAVISPGADETELEKRLGAILLAGDRVISFDNCEGPLGGGLLCQAITQSRLKVRVLGLSKTVEIPNNTSLFANGNNLVFLGDTVRRALKSQLDAGVERPELRTFQGEDPVLVMKRERGRVGSLALTVLRGYFTAGRPAQKPPLGGFEEYSRWVRDSLLWLGEADPIDSIEEARTRDPIRQTLEAVIVQWQQNLGSSSYTTGQLVDYANEGNPSPSNPREIVYTRPGFRAALLAVGADRAGRLSPHRLGRWLSRNKGKITGDRRIGEDTMLDGFTRWKLEAFVNGAWG